MKTEIVRRIFALLLSIAFVVAVQAKSHAQDLDNTPKPGENLETAKVLSVDAHPEGRPFDYIDEASTTYIYDGYPFYDITLQVDGKNYIVRYDNMGGYYPSAWKPGNEVKVRVDHGKMYILRYDGVLVDAPILQTSTAS
jgi:hypothetical protein